jgi:hypothetical protein
MAMVKALAYVLAMLAIVPLAGFCATGSVRQAWRFTLDWCRALLIMASLALVLVIFASI